MRTAEGNWQGREPQVDQRLAPNGDFGRPGFLRACSANLPSASL